VAALLFCGGALPLLFVIDRATVDFHDRPDLPTMLTVEEGRPFDSEGFKIKGGWRVGPSPDRPRRTTVAGLVAENTTRSADSIELDFGFYADYDEIGSIMCRSDLIEPGETAVLACDSIRRDVSAYDEITVLTYHLHW
jgi:hypothetical protein